MKTYVYRMANLFEYADTYTKIGLISFLTTIALLFVLFVLIHTIFRDTEDRKRKVLISIRNVLFAYALTITLAIFNISDIPESLVNGYAHIPELEGMTEEKAKKTLSNLGFETNIQKKYQKDVKLNIVYHQYPADGEKVVVKDATVTLCVNSKVVPDVKGYTLEKATELLESLGMIVDVKRDFSKTVKKEHIIKQSVKVGEIIEQEDKITLTVSEGIEFPNVIGKKAKKAITKLKKYGLTVETESGYNAEYEDDMVIAQRKKDKEKDAFDTTIILTINQPIHIFVPNLYNLGKDAAHAQLLIYGFLEKNIAYEFEYSNDIAKGNVIRQSIEAGQEVSSKQAIVITVSLGIKENSSNASAQGNNNKKAPLNDADTTPPGNVMPSDNQSASQESAVPVSPLKETPEPESPPKQPATEENSEGDIISDSGSDVIN